MINTDNYSTGCKICQQGKWLCIFLTHLCDAGCKFCPSPHKDDRIFSDLGDSYQEIFEHLKGNNYLGISFSGGDPILVFDRLIEWLHAFKSNLPHLYLWLYSTGLNVDAKKLSLLADNGLNEIRFNIAAMNYKNGNILKTIELAKKHIEFVAIEIPSIPDDYEKLIEVLPKLDCLGVDYLNMHEYLLVNPSEKLEFQHNKSYLLNYEIELNYHTESQQNTDRIKQFCIENKLKIKVNNCSLLKKENQMKLRRLSMGALLKNEYETLTDDGFLVRYASVPVKIDKGNLDSFFSIQDSDQFDNYLVRIQDLKKLRDNNFSTLIKLTYLPPISLRSVRKLIKLELLNQ